MRDVVLDLPMIWARVMARKGVVSFLHIDVE